MSERTYMELADELKVWAKDRRDVALDGYANAEELTELLDEAAQRLRDMPEGERIEGVVIEDEHICDVHRIVIHRREDPADLYHGYARATVILHTRKEPTPVWTADDVENIAKRSKELQEEFPLHTRKEGESDE